eukprot:TRINITY_DN248603_c0_g1_i3.p1 TRINITY_DN248603_c0_g1~~TRINITY_DN248603_c0_g1_i3.p1  ORF type:complete len:672 (-),score=188.42 TRINITY_DN248603_c0_g1_i3:180-2099(-)
MLHVMVLPKLLKFLKSEIAQEIVAGLSLLHALLPLISSTPSLFCLPSVLLRPVQRVLFGRAFTGKDLDSSERNDLSNVQEAARGLFSTLIGIAPLDQMNDLNEDVKLWWNEALIESRLEAISLVEELANADARIQLVPKIKPVATLRSYQTSGVSWLLFLQRAGLHGILADDMGLGKTLQALCAISASTYGIESKDGNSRSSDTDMLMSNTVVEEKELITKSNQTDSELTNDDGTDSVKKPVAKKENQTDNDETCTTDDSEDTKMVINEEATIQMKEEKATEASFDSNDDDGKMLPSLVLCPACVTTHWVAETKKFFPTGELNPHTLKARNRRKQIESFGQGDVLILSYRSAISKANKEALLKRQWAMVVLDEGHTIRNPDTETTRFCKSLSSHHRLVLSGTPLQNRVSELWSIFDFLMPLYLCDRQEFNKLFTSRLAKCYHLNASTNDRLAASACLEDLHKRVLPFILRRMKKDVLKDLPPKVIQDVECVLTDKQKTMYDDALNNAQNVISETETNEGKSQEGAAMDLALTTLKTKEINKSERRPKKQKRSIKKIEDKNNNTTRNGVGSSLRNLLGIISHAALGDPSNTNLQKLSCSGKLEALKELIHESGAVLKNSSNKKTRGSTIIYFLCFYHTGI